MRKEINHSHLTAKERTKLSFPTQWLINNNKLEGDILDYGCGFGFDVSDLKSKGFNIEGYDKYHKQEYPTKKYDTIICNYVLNVLEPDEQPEVLMSVSELLKPTGKAYFTVRRDLTYEGFRIHKIHQVTTFQCNVKLPYKSIFLNITAFIFVTIIIQIERQIILTVGKNNFLKTFRLLIAFIMAIIGSAILDQIIFKDDISKKMIEIVDRQVNAQLPARLTIINSKLQEIQSDVDSLDKKNLILYGQISKQPTIKILSTSITYLKIQQPDGTFKTVPQQTVSTNPINNPKIKEAEINNQHLDGLRKQLNDYTLRKMDSENLMRKELSSKQGFLEELNAIVEILVERHIALFFYLVLFCFLMFLELFVVASKFGDKKCDYDLIIEHQLEQKRRTLNELIK